MESANLPRPSDQISYTYLHPELLMLFSMKIGKQNRTAGNIRINAFDMI